MENFTPAEQISLLDVGKVMQQSVQEANNRLFTREKNIFAILAGNKKPINVETVRNTYLDRILLNTVQNWELLFKIEKLFSASCAITLNKPIWQEGLDSVEFLRFNRLAKSSLDEIRGSIYHGDSGERDKWLRELSDVFFDSKKPKLTISKGTTRATLDFLVAPLNLVAARPDRKPNQRSDKVTKFAVWDAYYIGNSQLQQKWEDGRAQLKKRIEQDPFDEYSVEDIKFYGLCDFLLDNRLKSFPEINPKDNVGKYKAGVLVKKFGNIYTDVWASHLLIPLTDDLGIKEYVAAWGPTSQQISQWLKDFEMEKRKSTRGY